jgi:NAD(P)-dependent dehydrogenase (short-subunit alcohol dehydrogenase family)
MRASLEGIAVFPTGAASGTGFVTATALAEAGAAVCIHGRDGYDSAARRRLRDASLALVTPFRSR